MRWIAAAIVTLATGVATADHGVPAPAAGRLGWTTWLLVAGAVVAVGLAAWAFFAPDRPDDPAEPGTRRSREPERPSR
jgi:hypothetical protein